MNYDRQQPYITLYKKTLERQGFVVGLEREFHLKWLMSRGKSWDAIHLHSIGQTYRSSEVDNRSELVKKLFDNRWTGPLCRTLYLACSLVAFLLAKLQGKIIVYTVHDLMPHEKEAWPFAILRHMAHWVVFSLADRIHVHNQYARQVLEKVYKRKDGVRVIPHGNWVGYYPNEISQVEARRQLGLPEDAFVYLFLGNIRPYKGVDDLVAAYEKLNLPQSQLWIVGRVSRGSRKMIQNLAQNNPAIKWVLEPVPDEAIQLYMNACNVCVLPYRWSTTSGAVMLAWTFGRPVIAPAIASFPELVTPETGILYDPSQPDALVSALQQARERSWSASAIFNYVHQFDWDRLGPQLASLYQSQVDSDNQGQNRGSKMQ